MAYILWGRFREDGYSGENLQQGMTKLIITSVNYVQICTVGRGDGGEVLIIALCQSYCNSETVMLRTKDDVTVYSPPRIFPMAHSFEQTFFSFFHKLLSWRGRHCSVRRKIRLIEGNAKCRHLKKLTCVYLPEAPLLLGFCLGWCRNFVGFLIR